MKKIYIVITHTGTLLSKIIRSYTKDEFSHVSLALDIDLKQMYSFGRLNPYNPFFGGFVQEYQDYGTFKRFKNTRTKIIELDTTDDQFDKLRKNIQYFKENKNKYKFNVKGMFSAGFDIKIEKKDSFYCAEFVKFILEESDINLNLPKLIKPENFKEINFGKEIYNGLLREYRRYL